MSSFFLPLRTLWAAIPANADLAVKRSHKFSHDLEAIYYTFVCVLLDYNGPKDHCVSPSARSTALQDLEDPDAKGCHNAKVTFLTNASSQGESFPVLTPYFSHGPIKMLLLEFTKIIKRLSVDDGPGMVYSKEEKEGIYKSILRLFRKAIKSITDKSLPIGNGLPVPAKEHRTDVGEGPALDMPTETVTDHKEAVEGTTRDEPENPFLDKEQDEEAASEKPVDLDRQAASDVDEGLPTIPPTAVDLGSESAPQSTSQEAGLPDAEDPKDQDDAAASKKLGEPTNTPVVNSGRRKDRASKGKETQVTKPRRKRTAATVRNRSPRKRGTLNLNKRIEEELVVQNHMETEERIGEKRKQQPVAYSAGVRSSKRLKAKQPANIEPEA